ncbi:hypothetical protein GCM10009609_71480 [Pseudonocardia aurantiaca]|uniref:Glycosyltransferase family 39 protein n=1 Tax=Pseudonocardia aurantiaca TaxID=75290 RepID=A0ABW4FXS4_9PSEU
MLTDDQTALLRQQRVPPSGETRAQCDALEQPDNEERVVGQRRALRNVAWLLPALLMVTLGLIRATWPSQQDAELDAWGFVHLPWREAIPVLGTGVSTTSAPYYLGLKVWTEVLGTSDFSLRLPSILAMAAAAALVALTCADLLRPGVGFLAGLFFAILPTTSRYAQEIGPQALVICFATLATFCLVQLFNRPGLGRMVGYGLAVVLLGLASAPALILLVGHGIAVLTVHRRVFVGWFWTALLSLAPTAALFSLLRTPQPGFDWTSPVDLPEVVRLPQDLFGAALLGGVVVGFGLLSFSFRKPGVIFTTWAIGPLLALYAASRFSPAWQAEALLFTVPAWTSLAAMALLRTPVVRGVFVALVVALLALPSHIAVRGQDGHGQATREVAMVLAENFKAGDVIVYGPWQTDGQIGRDLVARYLPLQLQPKDVLKTREPRTAGQPFAEECVDVSKCLDNAPRVWLFRAGPTEDVLAEMPAAKDGELRTRYLIERTWRPTGLTLTLFTAAPAAQPAAH